jgi:aspartate aminotransferase
MLLRKEVIKSKTHKFAVAAAERISNGLPVVSLGLGEPDIDIPSAIKESLISVLKDSKSGYSDPMGIIGLREKIALKLFSDNSISCSPENIIVTAGSKQAFTLICMALLKPGDEVILINPSFVSYIPQILIAEPACKVKITDVNKADFSLTVHSIEDLVTDRTKLLIINSPNNPTGYVFDSKLLEQIYLLADKKGFYIISDEVYEKLVFSKKMHFSIGSIEDRPTRVITVNSFSKSHSMSGWGLGYACFPAFLKSDLLNLQKHINTNTSTIIQRAMEKAFDNNLCYLYDYKEKLSNRANILSQIISQDYHLKLIKPDGGFFAFLNISKTFLDSNTFCSRLIQETGVALTPGLAFGDSWDDHVRLSFATSEDIIKEGLDLLIRFVRNI